MDGRVPKFDLYRELEVDPQATTETIEAAYRSLIRRHHPDAGSGTGWRATRLNLAREWLTDPARRALYDAEIERLGQGRISGPTELSKARVISYPRLMLGLALGIMGIALLSSAGNLAARQASVVVAALAIVGLALALSGTSWLILLVIRAIRRDPGASE